MEVMNNTAGAVGPETPTAINPETVRSLTIAQAPVVKEAEAMEIQTWEDYQVADGLLTTIADRLAKLGEVFDPIISQWHKGHRATIATKKELADPYEHAAKNILKPRMAAFQDAEEKRRRREEAERQEQARREAEEQQLAEAAALENAGHREAAEQVIQEERVVVPPVVPSKAYKPPVAVSSSARKTWSAEVTDLRALCRAIAEGQVPVQAVQPHMPYLNSQARHLKDALQIPGVVAKPTTGIASRRY